MQKVADTTYTESLIGTVAAATNSTGVDVTTAVGNVDVIVGAKSNQANTIAITLQHSNELAANYSNVSGVSFAAASNVANNLQTASVNKRSLKNYVRVNLAPAGSVNAAVTVAVAQRKRTA